MTERKTGLWICLSLSFFFVSPQWQHCLNKDEIPVPRHNCLFLHCHKANCIYILITVNQFVAVIKYSRVFKFLFLIFSYVF